MRPLLMIASFGALSVLRVLSAADARAENHVLLFEGGISPKQHNARYYNALREAYDYYKGRGVAPERIQVLGDSAGRAWDRSTFHDPDPSKSLLKDFRPDYPPKDGNGTKKDLKEAFKALSAKLKDGDTLEIMISDHGYNHYYGPLPQGALPPKALEKIGINLWNQQRLSVREFRDLFERYLGDKKITVRLQGTQCYSGALHLVSQHFNDRASKGGPAFCSVSSQSMWAPTETVLTHSSAGRALIESRREGSLFKAAMGMAAKDAQNEANGMLSSLSQMQRALGIDDFNPSATTYDPLRREVQRFKEKRSPGGILDDAADSGACATEDVGAPALGPSSAIILESLPAIRMKITADTASSGLVPDPSRIPGLTAAEREVLTKFCAPHADESPQTSEARKAESARLRAEGDAVMAAMPATSRDGILEDLRKRWLGVQAAHQRLLDLPSSQKERAAAAGKRYCRTLAAFLGRAEPEELEALGRTLKCELARLP